MSEYIEQVVATRPQVDPEAPFAEVYDRLLDAGIAIAKVVDAVSVTPADFLEEFGLRDETERTHFGAKAAVSLLSIQALVQEISGSIAQAFIDADDEDNDEDQRPETD